MHDVTPLGAKQSAAHGSWDDLEREKSRKKLDLTFSSTLIRAVDLAEHKSLEHPGSGSHPGVDSH